MLPVVGVAINVLNVATLNWLSASIGAVDDEPGAMAKLTVVPALALGLLTMSFDVSVMEKQVKESPPVGCPIAAMAALVNLLKKSRPYAELSTGTR